MIVAYLTMLRPHQWLKNLMLFFPPFLAGHVMLPVFVSGGFTVFCAFCLVSSSGYVFNDLLDRQRDLHHYKKRLRALPAGIVSVSGASLYAALLLVCGVLLVGSVSSKILMLLLGYAFVSFLYSLVLKNIPVVDLFCISAGFLIRQKQPG